MLKFSIGFFIVMLIGVGASAGKKEAGLKPGAQAKETAPAAAANGKASGLLNRQGENDELTKSLAAPSGQGQSGATRQVKKVDQGFAGHKQDQGFPGFQK